MSTIRQVAKGLASRVRLKFVYTESSREYVRGVAKGLASRVRLKYGIDNTEDQGKNVQVLKNQRRQDS